MINNSNEVGSTIGNPLISVITPVYNIDSVLLQTVKCIQDQSISNLEWIIVNDGSTLTETEKILNTLATQDSRIKIVNHSENKGLPAARNTGIKNSNSDFLFFLDGDDLIDSTFLEKAYLFLLQNEEYAFVNSYVIGFGTQDYKWKGGFHEQSLFLKENRNTSCFMSRRQVFDQVQFDEAMTEGCEDWDFWLHAASKGFWGFTIPEYLFYYRRSEINKWSTLKGKEALSDIQQQLKRKYEKTLMNGFPEPKLTTYSFGFTAPAVPVSKINHPAHKQLLCIFPWLQVGGGDQYNLNLLKGLKEKGWTVTIVTTLEDSHPWEDKFREITNDIFHFAHIGTEYIYSSLISYLIESRAPSLMFLSNSMYGYYALPYIKMRYPKLPIVDYLHCEDIGWYKGGYPYFSVLNTQLLDQTFTTSNNLSKWCIDKGADKNKQAVCYINVDTEAIKKDKAERFKIRKELNLRDNIPLILYVARLTQQKQPLVFIETLAALKKSGIKFYAIAIGDGPERLALEASIQSNALSDSIKYLGSQTNETVLKYMDAADVFFLPSLYEGIALSIFEAMAKELAIVGADVGGQSELVTETCGILVQKSNPQEDVNAYVNILSKLLKSPDRITQLGKNARKRVSEHFDLQEMIEFMHHSFLTINANKTNKHAVADAYQHMLNRMLYLETQNKEVMELAGSRAFRVINKYKRPYHKLKDIYHKLKSIRKD